MDVPVRAPRMRTHEGDASTAIAYYRGDHMKLDDAHWHCFTLSRYARNTGEWATEKAPVYHIVD
jgi:succinate dehydrogenase/fumarate reductase flavoprotein subunit